MTYGFTRDPAPQRARKERKASFLFRRTAEEAHTGGLEALALSEDGDRLYTASRDATVRSWDVAGKNSGRCAAVYMGHSNWVNDLVLLDDLLISCSSDYSISMWNANARGCTKPLDVLCYHTDYVQCLAACASQQKIATAGLRGQVAVWDIETAAKTGIKAFSEKFLDHSSPHGSVYAVDLDSRGHLLAVGSPEGGIRLSDVRSPPKSILLKGHSDNVRSIILSPDGAHCLSASADKTIRYWDTGQQRCIQTLAVHTDSVWTLATTDFQTVFSGGRDCCVYKTQLATRSSELILKEEAPVMDLALSSKGQLWTATTQSVARCWDLPMEDTSAGAPLSPRTPSRSYSGRTFYAAPSPQVRLRQTRQSFGFEMEPPLKKPKLETNGIPALVKCSTLQDRRHILLQDARGQYFLWDVATGLESPLEGSYNNFAEAESSLFRPEVSVAPWFSPDVKTGSLCLHLETPSCFAAEIYASELGFEDTSGMQKYNFGEHLLKAALEKWIAAWAYSYVDSGSANGANASELAGKSCFQLQCKTPPLLIGQQTASRGNRPFAKVVNELDASPETQDLIPHWVSEAVLKSKYPDPPELKSSFHVVSAEGSGLPSLYQDKLHAPRILTMRKIALYVVQELEKDGLKVKPHEPLLDASKEEEVVTVGKTGEVQQQLEFLCNGKAVPFDFSVGAIKAHLWRRSDEPVIKYRVYTRSKPAPYGEVKAPAL